ncbi:MAG: TonB-dependent receptor [Bacteroidales bacterium]|nr:TonB-dependent receptor [Bacteroidales bacterium]
MKRRIITVLPALFALLFAYTAAAQSRVTGRVTEAGDDGASLPVVGATVMVKGTSRGVVTDAAGNYEISAAKDAVLVFSCLGYDEQEQPVAGRNTVSVVLEAASQTLDEVVFIGYGYVKKSDLVSSVTSVNADDMRMQPAGTAAEMLRGRAAGVQVTSNSGAPGSVPTITIRGSRSISASNTPLYVIDGAVASDTEFAMMNASDIESIEVLKDAASLAIYGARASDGVILVTTKRGKSGASRISYEGYAGVQVLNRNFDFYSGDEWLTLRAEALAHSRGLHQYTDALSTLGIATVINDEKMEQVYKTGDYVDWEDLMFAPALYQNHSLSVRGGTEKFKTSASLGYYDQDGVMVMNSAFRRLSARVNTDYTVNKWLKLGVNSSFGWTRRLVENGAWYQFITRTPLAMVYDENGDYVAEINSKGDKNPMFSSLHDNRVTTANNYRINAFADITLTRGLSWRVNASYYNRVSEAGTFRDKYYPGGGSTASITNSTTVNTQFENILTYNLPFSKEPGHSLTLTAVQSLEGRLSKSLGYSSQNLPADKGFNFIANGENNDMTRTYGENNLVSFMLRAQYGYAGKYFLTLAAREDGSSRFGAGNKWGFFPSVAAAWRLDKEGFIKDLGWVNQLKLRASYGVVGNQNGIGNYTTLGLATAYPMEFGDAYMMGYLPGNSLSNTDLKWEKSATANFGLDFTLLDRRLSGTVEYYSTRTTNLLVSRSLNQALGYTSMLDNLGETRSHGVDLNINGDIIRGRDFNWSASLNFSAMANRIVKIDDAVDENGKPVSQPGNNWIVGEPINIYYDYLSDGIYQYDDFESPAESLSTGIWTLKSDMAVDRDDNVEPGSVKLVDVSKDGKISTADRVAYKKDPDFTVGFSTTFSWKGWDLFMDWYGIKGGYILNSLLYDNEYGGDLRGHANGVKVDYWTPNNPSDSFPRPWEGGEVPYLKTRAYQDASYLKLRNLQIGYNFPSKVCSALRMQKLRAYVSATNLLTFTSVLSYSPEVIASKYPETRQYVFGIKLTF